MEKCNMANNKKKAAPQAAAKAPVSTSKRAGYKRKSNRRVNVLDAQLARIARKAMNKADHAPKSER